MPSACGNGKPGYRRTCFIAHPCNSLPAQECTTVPSMRDTVIIGCCSILMPLYGYNAIMRRAVIPLYRKSIAMRWRMGSAKRPSEATAGSSGLPVFPAATLRFPFPARGRGTGRGEGGSPDGGQGDSTRSPRSGYHSISLCRIGPPELNGDRSERNKARAERSDPPSGNRSARGMSGARDSGRRA